jgi:ABC-type multidrug transport system fused ATPase/permease subunit
MVIALYNYMSQILVELIKLANLIVSIAKAIAGAKRIEAVFDIKSSQENGEIATGNQNCEYAVEFKNVSFSYKNAASESLSNISFKAKHGSTIGIIGATGSGKSTLVNLIPRFYDATEGRIMINGEPIEFYDMAVLREKIAVVPQYATLFKGTIRENLNWRKKDASDEELLLATEIAIAKDVIDNKGGLDATIEQGARNLSGGQKQRLTIARALVGSPEILILDDSASALDFATDAALRASIKEYCKDTTVFIVSQRTSSIMHADTIIVLDEGNVCGMGTHQALLENCSEYREIHDSQFRKVAAL